jgi:hypothetical protein
VNRATSFSLLPPNIEYLDSSFGAFASKSANRTVVIKDADYVACNEADSIATSNKYNLNLYKFILVDPRSPNYAEIIRNVVKDLKDNNVDTVLGCTYSNLCYEVSHVVFSFLLRHY